MADVVNDIVAKIAKTDWLAETKSLTKNAGITEVLATLTCIWFLLKVKDCFSFIWFYFLRPSTSLRKYGARKEAWAVVTGASDGIGKEFAKQLAKKGFHVVLISRNQSKLDEVATEIESKYKMKSKVIAADLNTIDTAVYDRIAAEISDLKVTILVNNAGVSYEHPDSVVDVPSSTVKGLVCLNAYAPTELTRRVLPVILKSTKKGLVINVGSGSATLDAPLLSVYGASKKFLESFSRALQIEYKRKLDVAYIDPLYAVSAMSKIRRASFTVPSAAKIASAALCNVAAGRLHFSPYWVHSIMINAMLLIPDSIRGAYIYKMHADIRRRALRRKEKAAGAPEPKKDA
mmetsp:Transcript_12781/g.20884  ORF Transcript_12781/g.20884 Transcript_12781/m.20884 type:complete len:346 (+) Transcript_12781:101-1138(+)